MAKQAEGSPTSELHLADQAREVPVPFAGGREYFCPNCEREISPFKQIRFAKPAKYEHIFNDVFRCPYCKFVFSPRTHAMVIRQ